METKITIHDLSLALVQRAGLHSSEADEFTRAFFNLIAEKVLEDKMVKVKGLGGFKLIDMSDRESVDVNTGERILIPGHAKISFTPDGTLRDQVNKPFADFQTVILNEGTSIEDMEKIEEEPVTEDDIVVDDEERVLQDERPATDESEENLTFPEDEVKESDDEDVPAVELAPVTTLSGVSESERNVPSVKIIHKGLSPWFTLVYVLLTLFLMALSYYVGYHRLLAPEPSDSMSARVSQEVKPNESSPAVQPQKPSPVDSVAEARRRILNIANQYPQVPGGKYLIVGTRRVHIMKVGDSLLKLALKEYGHKDFAQYIIIYNQFSNPDVIPVGYEVKLPELSENGKEPAPQPEMQPILQPGLIIDYSR